jgi:anti-sigma factor RsiW
MHDLTRDEMLDRLPELLHGTLSAGERAQIEAALRTDAELADDLATLRAVSATKRTTPAINIAQIVAALPAPPAHAVAPDVMVDQLAARRAAKRPWISTRFARAAALLVVVGGGTLVSVVSHRGGGATGPVDVVAESTVAGAMAQTGLGLGAPLEDLSVEQLKALEAEIQALDGVPSEEPDASADLLAGEGA